MYNISVDGSARPNPGIAGYGVFIEHRGEYQSFVKVLAGTHTNNEAEYHAVLATVQWLQINNTDNEDVYIHSDSKLVVNQLNGLWKCNDPKLIRYRDWIKVIIENFAIYRGCTIEVRWISRVNNELANNLAQAITKAEKERNDVIRQ